MERADRLPCSPTGAGPTGVSPPDDPIWHRPTAVSSRCPNRVLPRRDWLRRSGLKETSVSIPKLEIERPRLTRRVRKTILVVEDERLMRWSIREALRRDYRVRLAASAEEAHRMMAGGSRLSMPFSPTSVCPG